MGLPMLSTNVWFWFYIFLLFGKQSSEAGTGFLDHAGWTSSKEAHPKALGRCREPDIHLEPSLWNHMEKEHPKIEKDLTWCRSVWPPGLIPWERGMSLVHSGSSPLETPQVLSDHWPAVHHSWSHQLLVVEAGLRQSFEIQAFFHATLSGCSDAYFLVEIMTKPW